MKFKSVLLGVLIGVIALPTITLGGSFVVNLVQGKTPTESVQIIATQLDSLMGRVGIIESKQSKSELWQEKEDACDKDRDFMAENMPTGYEWFLATISHREGDVERLTTQINLPNCQECSIEDASCLEAAYLQGREGTCARTEDKKNWRQHLEANVRPELDKLISIKEQYLLLKQECDNLTSQYDSL